MVLEEEERLSIGDVTVGIIHAPGHTPGHLCVFFHEPKVLFLADYDLTAFGPWYGDRQSSIAATEASVRRLQRLPARVWLTCHETGVFEAAPPMLWDRYLDVIRQRRDALLDLLTEPRSMNDIVEAWIVYKRPREPLAFYRHAEQSLMEKHLKELIAQGRMAKKGRHYRRT